MKATSINALRRNLQMCKTENHCHAAWTMWVVWHVPGDAAIEQAAKVYNERLRELKR